MKKVFTLAMSMMLCTLQGALAGNVNFSAKGMPEQWDGALTAKTEAGVAVENGQAVADGTKVTLTAPKGVGYYVDWYVNNVKDENATDFTYTMTVSGNATVEARYVECFKFIFEGTPFVKYADRNGHIYVGGNFYHYKGPQNGAYGTSVSAWTGTAQKKGKTVNVTYNVDNVPNDTTFTKDTLEANVVLKPTYLDNGNDLGDASALAVWNFSAPDSVPTFSKFTGECHYVCPTNFNAAYTDVCMVCDATAGMLDNAQRAGMGNTYVKAGTKFRLPTVYGVVYTVAGTNEFTATTIDGVTPQKGMEGEYHTASLSVSDPRKDSIDIVIGEDQYIKYISASYPGGHTTLTWNTKIKTAESAISTLSKTGEAGEVLTDMTDIQNMGSLTVTPVVCDTLTSQIQMTAAKDETKFLQMGFKMAEDFTFNVTSINVPVAPIGTGTAAKFEVLIQDEFGNKLDTIFSSVKTDSLSTLIVTAPQRTATADPGIYLKGNITMKIFAYGADAKYALGSAITVAGMICETVTCGEGKTWAAYVTKGALDLEKQVGLHAWGVNGVDEIDQIVTIYPLEEGRQSSIILINTDKPGAVYNLPLTRADDAFSQASLLYVSDGTQKGLPATPRQPVRYKFEDAFDNYYFKLIPEGEVIPKGEVYLECKTFFCPDIFYKDTKDVPVGIRELNIKKMKEAAGAYLMMQDGKIIIVTPSGKTYNTAGARME